MTPLRQRLLNRNPYIFDRPINPHSRFVRIQRNDELGFIEEHLIGRGGLEIIDVYGPKRSGKSTFCLQLAEYLSHHPGCAYVKYVPLLSFHESKNFSSFLNELGAHLRRDLPRHPKFAISCNDYVVNLQSFLECLWAKVAAKHKLNRKATSTVVSPKAILILDGTESLTVCRNLISALRLAEHSYPLSPDEQPNVGIVISGTIDVFEVYKLEGGTPYSPAWRIELPDFSPDQTRLIGGVGFPDLNESKVVEMSSAVYGRCLGHPNVTQKYFYELFRQRSMHMNSAWEIDWALIDQKVDEMPDVNLDDTFAYIKDGTGDDYLHKMCRGKTVSDEGGAIIAQLKTLGAVKRSGRSLHIRNPFYHRHLLKYYQEKEEDAVASAVYDSALTRNPAYLDKLVAQDMIDNEVAEDIKRKFLDLSTEGHSLSLAQVTKLLELIKESHFGPLPILIGGSPMITTLFLVADPTDASRLRLGEEFREIQEKLQLARLRDRFVLHHRMSVRPEDLSQALLDVRPQVVHFSGHGTSTGELCFEDKLGNSHPISCDALAALFEQFADQVNCVVLNACYSDKQAKAIAAHINLVIGMSGAIGDEAAIAFSVGFYQALGAGRTIEDAYKLACVQIRLQSIPEHLVPILARKGKEAP